MKQLIKIYSLEEVPVGCGYSPKPNITKCDGIDFEDIEKQEIIPDAIFYWYESGNYEGIGSLIAVRNGKWYDKNLGHCSCYGPLEYFTTVESDYNYSSLEELLAQGTDDWQRSYIPLVELAKQNGY